MEFLENKNRKLQDKLNKVEEANEDLKKELKDIYKHVLGFLLEMVREDDPYGDHSDLENMFFKELGIFQN